MHPTAKKPSPTNVLYYGDNLNVMRLHLKPESVDLVYLDPPFNSKENYNAFFAQQDGTRAAAQIRAFEDTWRWDQGAQAALDDALLAGDRVAKAMLGLQQCLGTSNMMAYIAMMAPRLNEMKRVMKPNASIYLHCDPTASHYLKVLMDAVFGPEKFRSEIVWKRSSAHSDTKQGREQHGHIHDVILFYTKGEEWTWNPVYTAYDEEYVEKNYRHVEEKTGRRYSLGDLGAPGNEAPEKGNPIYEFMGIKRSWRFSKEKMLDLQKQGRIVQAKPGAVPRQKRYLDEMPGIPLQDVWTDIAPIGAQAAERLGYPTQKPEALLERIIRTSSNEGDLVLDPFCGCGTAVAVAERLKRRWIGIDVTYMAVSLMKFRLQSAFEGRAQYAVVGEPTSFEDAEKLADTDKYQFQWWALDLVGARPKDGKKGADGGIDGRLFFRPEADAGAVASAIISVKGGKVGVDQVRDLWGTVKQEGAKMGVFISMEEPTQPMREFAASVGTYKTGWGNFPALQLLTVKQLLEGIRINMPQTLGVNVTLKPAPKAGRTNRTKQGHFFENPVSRDGGAEDEE